MTRVAWHTTGNRFFESGIDRGVLYVNESLRRESESSASFGIGSKTFLLLGPGDGILPAFKLDRIVKVARSSALTQYMLGVVTASSPGSVTIDVYEVHGAGGPYTEWILNSQDHAVPWDGLTSVEQNGGDGATTAFLDGRPFLVLPKPKEYSSTLNAYAYPFEFEEVQGVAEASDGMYLDSQSFSSFGLSYRTLVGNDIDGISHAYKLHLIYNATVVPANLSYQSIGSQVNPVDFSWKIQAIPKIVDGYRPTAHIIIDSRKIEPEKLSAIEELLYGTTSTYGGLPEPQVVFDILTFGNGIVITDNGDGTWEAEGSSENIFLIGDEIFQIDNVNATDLGDGTYEISSTP